ncbi:hypothetical protein EG328_006956 [Venturia inaequalis]|uniref:Uncharacterized protein n=1 Tax=Venturia inaequalis TaxID=5025 RepID=A0A8H3UGZ5_VENIN|nr:hypothetical protein EG328_006956 [Venturia inaequalis]RDI83676.1 hypothetical protein Vi05172_g6249 [Venturia inaequalis]
MPHRSRSPYRPSHRLRDLFGLLPPAEAFPSSSNYGRTVSRSQRESYERHVPLNQRPFHVRLNRDDEQCRQQRRERRGREHRDREGRDQERRDREERAEDRREEGVNQEPERREQDRVDQELRDEARLLRESLEEQRQDEERLEMQELEIQELEMQELEMQELELQELEEQKLEYLKLEKSNQLRLDKERYKELQLEIEVLEKQKLEEERRLEKEKLVNEKLEKEKLVKEKLVKEKLVKEKLVKEKLMKEKLEKSKQLRLDKERYKELQLEIEVLEKQKLEDKQKRQKEKLEKQGLEKPSPKRQPIEHSQANETHFASGTGIHHAAVVEPSTQQPYLTTEIQAAEPTISLQCKINTEVDRFELEAVELRLPSAVTIEPLANAELACSRKSTSQAGLVPVSLIPQHSRTYHREAIDNPWGPSMEQEDSTPSTAHDFSTINQELSSSNAAWLEEANTRSPRTSAINYSSSSHGSTGPNNYSVKFRFGLGLGHHGESVVTNTTVDDAGPSTRIGEAGLGGEKNRTRSLSSSTSDSYFSAQEDVDGGE